MREHKSNLFLMLIFAIFSVLMFYFYDGGIEIGSFTILWKYIFAMPMIVLAFFYFLAKLEFQDAWLITRDSFVHGITYVVIILISCVIWVFEPQGMKTMTRGIFYALYQLIAVFLAAALVMTFKKDSVKLLFWTMIIGYCLVILQYGVRELGAGTFLRNYIAQLTSFGGAKESLALVEDAGLQFPFGALILYYLLDDSVPFYKRILPLLLSVCFFTVGLKRIAVPGVVFAFFCSFFVGKKKRDYDLQFVNFLSISAIVILFVYVVFARYNIIEAIYTYYGIDTKGRNEFMDFINQFYVISPTYLGYGIGFINRLMENLYEAGYISAAVLHNDIVRMYVELGFWGFLIWVFLFWYWRFRYFIKNRGKRVFKIVFAVVIYLTVTYLTDNTVYYFYTNLAAFTVMIASEYPFQDVRGLGTKDGEHKKL